eukprot:TRINITY_DN34870_c0_g1_i1.p1 TRINITY_DN34870_c0_g1~~TRINITY_DN34870_c0_g1_i1.p1  ORF type:complete len:306 (+),score=114.25 TRINITY_DN34870_c0_g1_i1:233-1150(+)
MAYDGIPVLLTSPGLFKLPAVQPYCLAAETLLRMAHVDFERVTDPTAAEVPRVQDGEDLVTSPCEGFLYVRKRLVPVRSTVSRNDAALSEEGETLRKSFMALCERKIAPAHAYMLCGEQAAWKETSEALQQHVGLVRRLFLQSTITKQEKLQAANTLTGERAAEMLGTACTALSEQLGKGEWMLGGSGPSSLDAVVFGFLATILYAEPQGGVMVTRSKLAAVVAKHDNLVQLCERVRLNYLEVYSLAVTRIEPEDEEQEVTSYPKSRTLCLLTTTISAVYFSALNIDFIKRLVDNTLEILADVDE